MLSLKKVSFCLIFGQLCLVRLIQIPVATLNCLWHGSLTGMICRGKGFWLRGCLLPIKVKDMLPHLFLVKVYKYSPGIPVLEGQIGSIP